MGYTDASGGNGGDRGMAGGKKTRADGCRILNLLVGCSLLVVDEKICAGGHHPRMVVRRVRAEVREAP